MTLQYQKEKLNEQIEGIQGEVDEFKDTYFNEDKEWNEGLGSKAWYPLKKLGDLQDHINDEVSLRNLLKIDKGMTDRIPGQWDEAILDYSYKDLRDHTAGGIGNLAGAITGSETVNDAFELGAQVLLPDAIDFATGGVGYADNLIRAAKKFDAKTASNVIDEVFNAKRVFGTKFNQAKEFAGNWGAQIQDAVTSPLRTVKGLVGSDSMVANIGQGLDQKIRKLSNTLSPNGLQNWGSTADIKRKAGARFISGVDNEPAFIQAGWNVLAKLNEGFGIDINRATASFQIHHKGVIRQVAESANGLTDEAARLAGDLISKKVGFKLGYDPTNAVPLPAQFHQRVHDIINESISGRWGDNLEGLIDIRTGLPLPRDWQVTMDLQARIDAGIYDQIAGAINEHVNIINKFWNSVATRTNLGKLSSQQYKEATFEVLEADDILTALRRTRNQSPDKIGYNITDAVNELLERAGRIDLQSPIFEKLDADMSKGMVKILLQRNGAKALQEVLTSNQSPATVFEAYGIKTKGYDTLFKQLNLPGFTNIKDPTGGKPLGRPKGSKDIKKRNKNKNVNQTEAFVEWNKKDYNDLINELKNILKND